MRAVCGVRVRRYRYQILDIIDTEVSLKNIDTCEKCWLFRSLSILFRYSCSAKNHLSVCVKVYAVAVCLKEVTQPCNYRWCVGSPGTTLAMTLIFGAGNNIIIIDIDIEKCQISVNILLVSYRF